MYVDVCNAICSVYIYMVEGQHPAGNKCYKTSINKHECILSGFKWNTRGVVNTTVETQQMGCRSSLPLSKKSNPLKVIFVPGYQATNLMLIMFLAIKSRQ